MSYEPKLSPKEIQKLQDGEYYWIAYDYPKDEDETWAIGKYDASLQWFNLCGGIVVTVKYVHEAQKVQPPL